MGCCPDFCPYDEKQPVARDGLRCQTCWFRDHYESTENLRRGGITCPDCYSDYCPVSISLGLMAQMAKWEDQHYDPYFCHVCGKQKAHSGDYCLCMIPF